VLRNRLFILAVGLAAIVAMAHRVISEIVQYWTAIYPRLADHRKVRLALKPALPQGCDHLSEDVPSRLTNTRKRLGTER
jgi:hypothetical protein